MSKANQGGTKAADTSKAGKAASPQDTAGKAKAKGYVVAEGHAFHGRNGRIEAGTAVSAGDLKSKLDPTGEREFQRQIDKGALVPGAGKAAQPEKAGGGVVDGGGATGAAPSGAQIVAAETGDDPKAAAVVDATLSGTEAELAKANGAENADAGKGE